MTLCFEAPTFLVVRAGPGLVPGPRDSRPFYPVGLTSSKESRRGKRPPRDSLAPPLSGDRRTPRTTVARTRPTRLHRPGGFQSLGQARRVREFRHRVSDPLCRSDPCGPSKRLHTPRTRLCAPPNGPDVFETELRHRPGGMKAPPQSLRGDFKLEP